MTTEEARTGDSRPEEAKSGDARPSSAPVVEDTPSRPALGTAAESAPSKSGEPARSSPQNPAGIAAIYEHPWAVRMTHWVSATAVIVLALSGLQIYKAFPSFGPKLPESDFVDLPGALSLGGWLAGALQWHFTFMWIFMAAGLLYGAAFILSGRYRTVLFAPRDIPGVWPMARHYFLFGPTPPQREPYNPLQKLAYTTTLAMGALAMLTGLVLYKPAQLSLLAAFFGGYRLTRVWHFVAMCGLVAFIPGHVIMVALHGWDNFLAMLTGWRSNPPWMRRPPGPAATDAG